ncbi:MAG TPA: ferric reductase-like transmembrane domain-containing protein [Kiloniellales bacterium]|nr:ferric reductase-like transmembrane domain-containing protein [Kiloniellales bacterium]
MTTSRAAAAQRSAAILRAAALAVLFLPFAFLASAWIDGELAARPWDTLTHWSGRWALWLLLLTLAVTPLRRIAEWPRLVLARRRLGVGAACYAGFHLFCFLGVQGFDLARTASEIVLRVYLAVGFSAFLILLALGTTSTDRALRWMGGPGWQALHRLVYPAALLAVLHFFLQAKAGPSEPALRGGLLLWLLAWRAQFWLTTRSGERRTVGALGLVVLTLAVALSTALLEAASISLKVGAPFERVLLANLSLGVGLRPAWIVLGSGFALAALALWRSRAKSAVRARQPAAAAT